MAYLSEEALTSLGVNVLGADIKVSEFANIYQPNLLNLKEGARIDDYCILSGSIEIGRYVHIAPFCIISSGSEKITIDDYSTLGYRSTVISRSDDYLDSPMSGPLVRAIDEQFVQSIEECIYIGKNVVIGANCTVLPGAQIGESASVGAYSLVKGEIQKNMLYHGIPAKAVRKNKRDILL